MQAEISFKGAEELIALVDKAVQAGTTADITSGIKRCLCKLINSGEMQMPECVLKPVEGHYARRLLYRSPEHGYSMVAMTWGASQGTPLHDHAGLWCVEAVCQGEIEVAQYELLENNGDRYRFERSDDVHADVGTAGCLIPPHEYHTIRNAMQNGTAVTLHIYGGDMEYCNMFQPENDGWYRKIEKTLCFDSV